MLKIILDVIAKADAHSSAFKIGAIYTHDVIVLCTSMTVTVESIQNTAHHAYIENRLSIQYSQYPCRARLIDMAISASWKF